MTDRIPPQETRRVTLIVHRPFRTSLGIALGLMAGLFIPGLLLGFIISAIAALR